ncbi:MAG: thioredoxin domain-containing protein [Dehalococcoidia bacterium]|nr:thioredoxin domain-containing protein [Dehalococcoidia bacterium]
MVSQHRNRLATEKSPYLQQHAANPVDWYPWCPEAFIRAKLEDKPVFLSIGYATCHWCHVMAHESFEDPEVARLMNEVFVSVKVDREERPDVDAVYMEVCQALTGSGGWPLTVIMTPDKEPFFAATYIPKRTRFGRIGMLELVPRIADLWKKQRAEILRSAKQISALVRERAERASSGNIDESVFDLTYQQLKSIFDEKYGGFGDSPKFPTPHNLTFLLRYWRRTGDDEALRMVEKTLIGMRLGGIFDHIGFGFHRYSTDPGWVLPHFEKMLYDQAGIAVAYLEAFQATGKPFYARTAGEIFTYVLDNLTAPGGGFYCGEDADSEGKEGKFYLWSADELRSVLKDDAELAMRVFNVAEAGNVAGLADEETGSRNVLFLAKPLAEIAEDLKLPLPWLEERLELVRQKLLTVRNGRVRPLRDDKVLADWNGLMIGSLARGARVLERDTLGLAAVRAADFILGRMMTADGRLWHRYRDGELAVAGFLDDYAFMVWGLVELYETTLDVRYLKSALTLNEKMIRHFGDALSGGFYHTADDSERLLLRQKPIYDGALPSGNSVALLNLLRLARMTGRSELEETAQMAVRAFAGRVSRAPSAYTQFMSALDYAFGPSYEIVVSGVPGREDTRLMLAAVNRPFFPNKVFLFRPDDEVSPEIVDIAGFTSDQHMVGDKATVYVCHEGRCEVPVTESEQLLRLLDVRGRV